MTTKKPKTGRPPLAGQAASEVIKLRVTVVARKQWEAAAGRAEVTLSEWLREAAERALKAS